ncbi:MAG TPA: DUF1801 domain-containing protein [Candidatus Dormibacteraeota bacterium]|nr:DUF1801 domain-containing protein [Candidatus Dormibacteraeota bacterium]
MAPGLGNNGAVPVSVDDHLKNVPAAVRPIVAAARKTIRATAPKADETAYQSKPPKSASAMWKLARYSVDGEEVAGLGTFARHSTIYFYRGRELDDPQGLLQGSGKDTRFVTLRTPSDAEGAAVKELVREAFALGRKRSKA